MSFKDLLFEIGTEELPARFLTPALQQLKEKASELLHLHRLTYKNLHSLGTPRRLAVLVESVPESSPDRTQKISGPAAELLKDPQGHFTPQAQGFARSQGVRVEALKIEQFPKGAYLIAERILPGERTAKLLPKLLIELVRTMHFPKSMVWEKSRMRFARPIRTLLALWGKQLLPLEVGTVRSGKAALGPAFDGAKKIRLSEPGQYVKTLRSHYVYVNPEERKEILLKALHSVLKDKGLHPLLDPNLVEEVTNLTEFPTAVLGELNPDYLELPPNLLIAVLKKQQRFFPTTDAAQKLQPYFVGIRNGISEKQDWVRGGYERVVNARLEDARFFMERDRQSSLTEKLPRLGRVIFHEKLGTLEDKKERVISLALWLLPRFQDLGHPARQERIARIARLGYADLTTEAVQEFPELQGSLGAFYAEKDGEEPEVVQGIRDFYQPENVHSPLPQSWDGKLAALAEKIDTLAGSFSIGLAPSGSEDPHGLRRKAMGVIRILLESDPPISLSLKELLQQALAQVSPEPKLRPESAYTELERFLRQRLEGYWSAQDFRPDEIRAVEEEGLDSLVRTQEKLKALHQIRCEPDFASLAEAFKRAANILKQAGHPWQKAQPVREELLREEAERGLYQKILEIQRTLSSGGLDGEKRFFQMLRELMKLKPPVAAFFDQVRVMVEDPALKTNRLNLLAALPQLSESVADLSKLQ